MKKKNSGGTGGIVFSTDPNFKINQENESGSEAVTPEAQKLKVRLETKHRAGKAVTLITGFVGVENELAQLGKDLKNYCGTGGSVKDGEIIIQGDQRDKVMKWLVNSGFKLAKKI